MEDTLQIHDGNLVAAFLADVFGGIAGHVHLVAADAVGDASKEVDGFLGHDRRGRTCGLPATVGYSGPRVRRRPWARLRCITQSFSGFRSSLPFLQVM